MRTTTRLRLLLGTIVIVLLAIHIARRWRDPSVVLLMPEAGAQWMRVDTPASLRTNLPGERHAVFRTHVQWPRKVELTLRALRRVDVRVNGRTVFDSGDDLTRWKQPHVIQLDLAGAGGPHELALHVSNRDGPAMVLAYADEFELYSGPEWEASTDGKNWSPAATADAPMRYSKPTVPRPLDALLKIFPWLIPVAILGAAWGWFQPRWITPGRLCIALLTAWAILAVNNLPKLPPFMGYDMDEHLRYIDYVARHKRLPLADEGWQMFQSPLYYVISAPLFASLDENASDAEVMGVLRIVPMLCGGAMIVLCYYAARYALPGRRRRHLRSLAVLLGGLLPMKLYISQNIGNEPLSGVLSGLAIVLMLRYLRQSRDRTDRAVAGVGGTLGLALLAKVSAALLVPVMTCSIAIRRRGMRRVITFLLACGLICGWYYAHNVIHFGRPFVAGWEADRVPWWQEPGYRTPGSFIRFGQSLVEPLYAGVYGFWDGLYSTLWADGFTGGMITDATRPPWNYTLMSAGMILSLLPTAGIIAGLFLGLRNRCLRFAAGCVAVFLIALADLFLVVPIYSTVKATYLLGLTPLLGSLFAAGIAPLTNTKLFRVLMYGWLSVWAVLSYGAFFVL